MQTVVFILLFVVLLAAAVLWWWPSTEGSDQIEDSSDMVGTRQASELAPSAGVARDVEADGLRHILKQLKPEDFVESYPFLREAVQYIESNSRPLSAQTIHEVLEFITSGDVYLGNVFMDMLSKYSVKHQIIEAADFRTFSVFPKRYVLLQKMALSLGPDQTRDFFKRTTEFIARSDAGAVNSFHSSLVTESIIDAKFMNNEHMLSYVAMIAHPDSAALRRYHASTGRAFDPELYQEVLAQANHIYAADAFRGRNIISEIFTGEVIKAWKAHFGALPSEGMPDNDLKKGMRVQEYDVQW